MQSAGTASMDAEEQRNRFAAIVASSDDAIISKTLDGIIETWNESATRIFGYSSEEVIGKPITILIPPDRLDEEPAILPAFELASESITSRRFAFARMEVSSTSRSRFHPSAIRPGKLWAHQKLRAI